MYDQTFEPSPEIRSRAVGAPCVLAIPVLRLANVADQDDGRTVCRGGESNSF